MKYRKRKIGKTKIMNFIRKKEVTYAVIGILIIAGIYLFSKLFIKKEVLIEEPAAKEVIETKKEEVFMEDLDIISEKVDLSELNLQLDDSNKSESGQEKYIDVKSKDILEEARMEKDESITSENLTGGYKIRDEEKQGLIKRAEEGLNEWKDDEGIYEILESQNKQLLEEKDEERSGE